MTAPRILVTGATDGIGLATARALRRQGAELLVHGRSPPKVQAVAAELGAWPLVADLSSLAEVRRLAREAAARGPLDVVLNNAGVFAKTRQLTVDGHELSFGVNHLAHFLLTNLLLDALRDGGRVVTVSSIAHSQGQIHWDDLTLARNFSGYTAYAQSKLANVLFANALAPRVASRGITSNSLHPGVINTRLLREGFGASGAPVESGARTSVQLALSPELAGITGRYFKDAVEVPASPRATDPAAAERLWTLSAALVGGLP